MCQPPRAVIFDLDGTLVQTRLASWEVFRPVNDRYELGVERAEQFYELFSNNFFASLRRLCRDESHAQQVEQAFMEGLQANYDPPMIPGMADVVRSLAPHCTLAVLSSNVTSVVRRILLGNELAYCFAHVFGGDVEPDKQRGIRRFLADAAQGAGRRCEVFYDEEQPVPCCDDGSAVLVTDTVGDIQAAMASGIRAVGVTWGMHSEAELLDAGCEFVAIWPQELVANMLGRATGTAQEHSACSCALPAATPTEDAQRRAGELRRQRRSQATGGTVTLPTAPNVPTQTDGTLLDEQLRAAMRRILS
jgi:phosphoglycolate phosphatase